MQFAPTGDLAAFEASRPRLFGIAYRMLGSAAEAEDVVQDAWLRWQSVDHSQVREPAAFLATTVTRLAIDALNSARMQRETYIGPWLPEPVDTSQDPYLGAERGEALEMAVLLLLEKLKPAERAAYVLREAFDYGYEQIAQVLETSEANCRQLVTRARKHLATERHQLVSREQQEQLLESFLVAAENGDTAALERLFTADIISFADGGGVVTAARVPVLGRERVAQVIAFFGQKLWPGITVKRLEVNGEPAALLLRGQDPYAVIRLEASAEGVHQVMWVMNPAKLERISSTLSQN
ncbi:RNA polymerase sigma-70 factor [Terriglobus albidus]|uniref:RNA polymerase sigma-70 factor n=1 Tax=Terriglobus albidus TaxID=1592106 RepID=A0A5B9EAT8_9BACT|nr:RNA polymerase sigma-70 factor [Terriglobus albidus]QEE27387.1 RNA polymerase sigma-70 factor [Terriglobus albidus]